MSRNYAAARYQLEVKAVELVRSQSPKSKGHWQTKITADILGVYDPETKHLVACDPGEAWVYVDWQKNDGTYMIDIACAQINKAFGCLITDPDDIHKKDGLSLLQATFDAELSFYVRKSGEYAGAQGESWRLPRIGGVSKQQAASLDEMKKAMKLAGVGKKAAPRPRQNGNPNETAPAVASSEKEIPF